MEDDGFHALVLVNAFDAEFLFFFKISLEYLFDHVFF